MRRLTTISFALAAALACGQAAAQAPSPTTPPDKIDPEPIPRPTPSAPDAVAAPKSVTGDGLGIAANVLAVRVAGPWEAEGKKGFSRVALVTEGGVQRLYVQWLAEPDAAVVATKELVDEEAQKVTFGDVRAERERTGVSVFLDTVPDRDGLRDTWVLIPEGPGEARFGPATN